MTSVTTPAPNSFFADSGAAFFFHSYGGDEFDFYSDVVTRHNHLNTFVEGDDASYVSRAGIETADDIP